MSTLNNAKICGGNETIFRFSYLIHIFWLLINYVCITMNNKNKLIYLLHIIRIVDLVPIAQAQSSDWNLTVNINKVNLEKIQ